jgi:hypothetical protein
VRGEVRLLGTHSDGNRTARPFERFSEISKRCTAPVGRQEKYSQVVHILVLLASIFRRQRSNTLKLELYRKAGRYRSIILAMTKSPTQVQSALNHFVCFLFRRNSIIKAFFESLLCNPLSDGIFQISSETIFSKMRRIRYATVKFWKNWCSRNLENYAGMGVI